MSLFIIFKKFRRSIEVVDNCKSWFKIFCDKRTYEVCKTNKTSKFLTWTHNKQKTFSNIKYQAIE